MPERHLMCVGTGANEPSSSGLHARTRWSGLMRAVPAPARQSANTTTPQARRPPIFARASADRRACVWARVKVELEGRGEVRFCLFCCLSTRASGMFLNITAAIHGHHIASSLFSAGARQHAAGGPGIPAASASATNTARAARALGLCAL
ncbi:hypothetical protein BDV96DRAFT_645146 [Lophiotrema nucula]|uniref:Uncharacterized protein n=1 Tax=Lophiotrema nucula TaxID=690887 RepID=A0A6A5ZCF8_9PLEO|nr:hypothetical protein BDV96DRAFT_645146 [Lophiotrema nucula]